MMNLKMSRREWLSCGAFLGASLLVEQRSGAEPAEARPVTYAYKEVGPLAIKADVYRQPGDRHKTGRGLDSWRRPDHGAQGPD